MPKGVRKNRVNIATNGGVAGNGNVNINTNSVTRQGYGMNITATNGSFAGFNNVGIGISGNGATGNTFSFGGGRVNISTNGSVTGNSSVFVGENDEPLYFVAKNKNIPLKIKSFRDIACLTVHGNVNNNVQGVNITANAINGNVSGVNITSGGKRENVPDASHPDAIEIDEDEEIDVSKYPKNKRARVFIYGNLDTMPDTTNVTVYGSIMGNVQGVNITCATRINGGTSGINVTMR